MRRSSGIFLFLGLLAAFVFGASVFGEETTFKITDYIPEKFTDLELRVGGGANLNGNHDVYDSQGLLDESQSWSTDVHADLSYDFETVPQFLDFDLGFNVMASDRDSERYTTRRFTNYPGAGEITYGKVDVNRMYFNLRPAVDAGKYVLGDFFLSGVLSADLSYLESPDGENYNLLDGTYFEDTVFRTRFRESSSRNAYDYRRASVVAGIMPGWGRLYEGSYAAAAIYIIDELRRNNVLLREPTHDEMVGLCDLVYRNRLRHAVDERLKRIETFDQILAYLADAGLTDQTGSRAYLYFQDVWDYFPQDRRQFGLRSRVGFRLEHTYNRSRRTSDNNTRELETQYYVDSEGDVDTTLYVDRSSWAYRVTENEINDLYFEWRVEYGLPLSRQWQLSIDGLARYVLSGRVTDRYDGVQAIWGTDYYNERIGYSERKVDSDGSYLIGLTPSVAYIYSSRTRMDLWATFRRQVRKRETREYTTDGLVPGVEHFDEDDMDLSVKASLRYRLAIPTTLSINVGYNYDFLTRDEWILDDDYVDASGHDFHREAQRYVIGVSLSHYLY